MKNQIICLMIFLSGISLKGFSQASFTMDVNAGCSPVCVNFQDQSVGGLSWLWDFGDASAGSTTQNPSHCYVNSGSYTVTLTETFPSGTATATGIVTVFSNPVAAFLASNNNNNTFDFSDLSYTLSGTIESWSWDFGDTSAYGQQQNPTHIYANSGIHTVCLLVVDVSGCSDSTCQTIMVTGLNEINSTIGWNIFPNPNHGIISIHFDEALKISEMLSVENVLGEIILQKEISNNTTIDLSNQPSGIYFVRVGNSPAKKLVIE